MQASRLLAMALCASMLILCFAAPANVGAIPTAPVITITSSNVVSDGKIDVQIDISGENLSGGSYSHYVNNALVDQGTLPGLSRNSYSHSFTWSVGQGANRWDVTASSSDDTGTLVGSASYSLDYQPDSPAPIISGVSPAGAITLSASGQSVTQTFTASYSDVTSAIVTLDDNDVSGEWGVTTTGFSHAASLSLGSHIIVLTVGNAAGKTAQQTWTVTVEAAKDTTAPTVIGILPGSEQNNVGVDTNVAVTFSEAMNQKSVDLSLNGVKGTTSWSGNTVTFVPSSPLDKGKTYNAKVSGKDVAGNSMDDFSWSFTTDDGEAPQILDYSPVGDDVSVNSSVWVEFSEAMNQNSVSLTVESVNGTISWSGNTITFQPSEPLANGSLYNAKVSGTDLGGTSVEFNWSFSTKGGVSMHSGEGAISGMVKGTNGKGIGQATVVLNQTVSTTTDANGAFSITNVTAGSYDLIVSKDGYDPVEKKVNVTSGLTSVVSLNIKSSVARPLISDGSVVLVVMGGMALAVVTLSMFWKRKGKGKIF